MRYNTKFAFLAVAVLCATTFALPLSRNADSIVAREVNNDISAREFYAMYLKARADGDDGDSEGTAPSSQGHKRHGHRKHHVQSDESTNPGVNARENSGDGDGDDDNSPSKFKKLEDEVGKAGDEAFHHHHHHHHHPGR